MAKERTLKDAPKDMLVKLVEEIKKDKKKSPTAGEKLQHLNTRIPESLIVDIKVHCAKNKIKIQDFVTEVFQEKLKESK